MGPEEGGQLEQIALTKHSYIIVFTNFLSAGITVAGFDLWKWESSSGGGPSFATFSDSCLLIAMSLFLFSLNFQFQIGDWINDG